MWTTVTPSFSRSRTSRLPRMWPKPASPVTATDALPGNAFFAAIAAARLKPSVETLPQPRKPRGISVSKTALSGSVAGFVRHKRIAQIQRLHEIVIHPIRIDGRLVRVHDLPVSGERLVACRPHFRGHVTQYPSGAGRAVGYFLAERLQGQARI